MSWHPVAAIAAVSLGLTGTAASAAPDDPRVDPTAEVLTADHDRHERMTVPVTIRGQGPFPFLIDTGAQATVLSLDLADRLQLNDRKTATLVGMASRQQVETTPVDEFTLGSRSFYVRQAPLVAGENIGGGADGILGLDALQDQRVVLDFKKGEIAVADHAEAGSSRGYEIVVKARERLGQLIITKARLDGVTVDVIIDTGAQGSVGNLALLNRLRRAREIGETEMTDINGFTLAGALRLGRELQAVQTELALALTANAFGAFTAVEPGSYDALVFPAGDPRADRASALRCSSSLRASCSGSARCGPCSH